MMRAAVLLLACVLSACGFQLRGDIRIDPALSPISVEGVHSGSPLLPAVRVALAAAGMEVSEPGGRAASLLRIIEDEAGERIISVNPQGRPREAELYHRVVFELHDDAGILLPARTLVMTREYAVDERDVLGRAHEADVLKQALQRDIVNALVRQLEPLEGRHRP